MGKLSELQQLRNRAASAKRWGRDDAVDLARQLRAEKLAREIEREVATWPPFTDQQWADLRRLLRPDHRAAEGDAA
jgi:hypothetical protein